MYLSSAPMLLLIYFEHVLKIIKQYNKKFKKKHINYFIDLKSKDLLTYYRLNNFKET